MDSLVDINERRRPDIADKETIAFILAMQALFETEFDGNGAAGACNDVLTHNASLYDIEQGEEKPGFDKDGVAVPMDFSLEDSTWVREATRKAVTGTMENLEDIDRQITSHITCDWTLDRLGRVERSVLRLGTQLLRTAGEPRAIEAGKIPHMAASVAAEYCNPNSHGLIMGILDSIRRELAGQGKTAPESKKD